MSPVMYHTLYYISGYHMTVYIYSTDMNSVLLHFRGHVLVLAFESDSPLWTVCYKRIMWIPAKKVCWLVASWINQFWCKKCLPQNKPAAFFMGRKMKWKSFFFQKREKYQSTYSELTKVDAIQAFASVQPPFNAPQRRFSLADTSSSTMRVLRGRRYPAGGKTLFTGERLSPARGKHRHEDSLKNATRFSNQKAKNHSGAPFYQMPRIFLSSSRTEKSFLTEFKHSNTKTDKKSILWLSQRWLRPAEVS